MSLRPADVMYYNHQFKTKDEIKAILEVCDNKVRKNYDGSYDILKTEKVYVNGGEISLSSDVVLFDECIVIYSNMPDDQSICTTLLPRQYVSKIEFLDNTEKKGAAVILTTSKKLWKNLEEMLIPESFEYYDRSLENTILIIPIMNSNENSINGIRKRLNKFCYFNNNTNLSNIILKNINFFQLKILLTKFKLKPITYKVNETYGKEVIIFMRNDYSILTSNVKLMKLVSRLKMPIGGDLHNSISQNFKNIKDDVIFKKCRDSEIFVTHNIDIDEKFYVGGKAFGSLFGCEWLNGDIIDSYLNEWRRRIKTVMEDPIIVDKICFKIYGTLWFTRLTRRVTFTSSKKISKTSFSLLQENARKVSRENIHLNLSTFCTIFDFDILIIPIHRDNHWTTGIIYKPRNCLIDKTENDSSTMKDTNYTYIIIFDSMNNEWDVNKCFYFMAFGEYIKACHLSLNEKLENNYYDIDEKKLKIVKLHDPYKQGNGYDCGLFMLEFIRQILLSPKSIDELIKHQSMKKVFPNFNVSLGRNNLKTFVYSKVDVKKWILLYEMEQYFLTRYCGKDFRCLKSRSDECITRRRYVRRFMARKRRASI